MHNFLCGRWARMEEKMIEEGGKRTGGASFSGCNRDLISIECSERKLN